MMRIIHALLLYLMCSVAAKAGEPTPLALLQAMQHALLSQNYQGTLVILKNAKLDTVQYTHTVNQSIEQERLKSLNSPLREVVRKADTVSCLFTTSQQMLVDHRPHDHSLLVNLPTDLNTLTTAYNFKYEGEAQIALQAADIVSVSAQDQYRYTRKFWIAKQSHLLLKMEVQNFTGEPLEQLLFTDLHAISAPLPLSAKVSNDKPQAARVHQITDLGLDKLPMQLTALPKGFEQRSFTRVQLTATNKSVAQLLLSDGLSAVSVYLEKQAQNFHAGLQSAGAVNSFSRIVRDYSLTVMGDVPAATVEFIAQGIILSPDSNF